MPTGKKKEIVPRAKRRISTSCGVKEHAPPRGLRADINAACRKFFRSRGMSEIGYVPYSQQD